MAKKFIDAEMLIGELDAACMPIFEKGISGDLGDEDSIADIINAQPAADVQEVVRCKNCKYLLRNLTGRNAQLCMQNFFKKLHLTTVAASV